MSSRCHKAKTLGLVTTVAVTIGVLGCRVAGPEPAALVRQVELDAELPEAEKGTTVTSTAGTYGSQVAVLETQVLIRLEFEAAHSAANEHRKLVLSDLAESPLPEWAGTYRWSNGYEHRALDLGPRGFFYEYSHCTGTGELAYGEVTSVDGLRVHLRSEFRKRQTEPRVRPGRRSDFEFEDELFSVPWGYERFLVPASLMREFCAMAKATGFNSMEYSNYPRKVRDGVSVRQYSPKMAGLPEVPAEFRHLLPY